MLTEVMFYNCNTMNEGVRRKIICNERMRARSKAFLRRIPDVRNYVKNRKL